MAMENRKKFIDKNIQDSITLKSIISKCLHAISYIHTVSVKIRNMKMDFKTRGTWRRVGQ